MTYYLADTENIADRWRAAASNAASGDMFLLFYTSISKRNLDFDAFAPASFRGVGFRFIKCYNKRENALDFQLTVYLGMLFASHPDDRFVILSGDGGYDAAVLFLRDLGADVQRIEPDPHSKVSTGSMLSRSYIEAVSPVAEYRKSPEVPTVPPQPEVRRFINSLPDQGRLVAEHYEACLAELGFTDQSALDEAVEILYHAMKDPPNTRKAAAYKAFLHKYGVKFGQERYRVIKDFVKAIATNGPLPPVPSKVVPGSPQEHLMPVLKTTCPDLTDNVRAVVANAMLKSCASKNNYSTYLSYLQSAFGVKPGWKLYKQTDETFMSLLPDKSEADIKTLETAIANACPELDSALITAVRSAMEEARRISPKNRVAGYGTALMSTFPDHAARKQVFARTKELLKLV